MNKQNIVKIKCMSFKDQVEATASTNIEMIQWTYLYCVQITCFGCLQKSVVHVRITRGDIF